MVDNGKYRIVFTHVCIVKFITNLRRNTIVKTIVNCDEFKQYVAYVYNLDDIEKYSKEELKKMPCLEINIKYFEGTITIDITNSLRKWFFGRKQMRNFSLTTFKECLKLLSKKLSVEYQYLLNARITILEVGVNLRLDKSFQTCIITATEHKRLGDVAFYKKGTVAFEGENLKLIFYNKLLELYDMTDMKLSTFKKISEIFFFLRIEVIFKKVSGVKFAKNNCSTVNDLICNWEAIYDYCISQVGDVTFVDWISPKIVDEIKINSDSEFYKWLDFSGIDSMGFNKVLYVANDVFNRPSVHKKRLKETTEKYRRLKNPSFESLILEKLKDAKKYILS